MRGFGWFSCLTGLPDEADAVREEAREEDGGVGQGDGVVLGGGHAAHGVVEGEEEAATATKPGCVCVCA